MSQYMFHPFDGGMGTSFERISDVPEFQNWLQEIKLELQGIYDRTHDTFVWETINLCGKRLDGFTEKKYFIELVGKLQAIRKNIADYKTNLNYKSSGWFFLCNLYKNGKTRKRCKRMNDSAFLNSRRTGIFKDMSNGTICIPKDLRDNNGLEKNDRVELIPMQEGIYIRKAYGEKKCQ